MITIEAWVSRLLVFETSRFRLITIGARMFNLIAIGVGGLG